MSPKTYATGEAAKAVKVSRQTLQAWIASGKVKAPEPIIRDGRAVRLWSEDNIRRLRQLKERIYRPEGGRPPKKGRRKQKA